MNVSLKIPHLQNLRSIFPKKEKTKAENVQHVLASPTFSKWYLDADKRLTIDVTWKNVNVSDVDYLQAKDLCTCIHESKTLPLHVTDLENWLKRVKEHENQKGSCTFLDGLSWKLIDALQDAKKPLVDLTPVAP